MTRRAPPSIRTPRSTTPPPSRKTARKAETLPRVAFLGLGAMGAPMATMLARKGYPLAVWNRTPARARPFARLGARVATSPRACAEGADVVVTILTDAPALRAILEGEDGLLAGLGKKALVVDMSTIGRAEAREIARVVQGVGAAFVDAPVSGTVGPAARGELVAMAGGTVKDVARAEVVLRAMCKRVLHAGAIGQGQALKVTLNALGAHHFVAFASALVLAERAGIAREVAIDAFTSGAFASPSYVGKKTKVLARDYSPEFSLALTQKDAHLGIALQEEIGLVLPVHREITREIDEAVAAGLGALDLYGIEKYFDAMCLRKP